MQRFVVYVIYCVLLFNYYLGYTVITLKINNNSFNAIAIDIITMCHLTIIRLKLL